MADPVTGVAVASLGVGAAASIMSGNAKADAARQDAANKRLQADEVEKAGARQQYLLETRGQQATGQAATAIGKSGFEMSGTGLLHMEEMARQINEESLAQQESTQFRAAQLRRGADVEEVLGGQEQTAGYLGAGSDILMGAARATKLWDKNTQKTTSLGGGSI